MNTHILINYGIIKTFHDNGKSIVTTFLPLVEYGISIISNEGKDYYDRDSLNNIIFNETGVKIPILTLNNLLKRLQKDGSINVFDKVYFRILNLNKLKTSNYFREKESAERRFNKFLAEYKAYTNDDRNDETIKDELYKFIQYRAYSTDDKQSTTAISFKNFFKFLEYINKQEDELVKIYQDIYFGYVLCSLLEKEANLENIKLKDFTIYLDSNFILRLMDLQEECFTSETKELFNLLKESGVKLLIFDETIKEIISVLEYYKDKYIKEKDTISSIYQADRINGVFGAYFRRKFSISKIDDIIEKMDSIIESFGIRMDSIARYNIIPDENKVRKLYERKYGAEYNGEESYQYNKCKNYISIIEIIKYRRKTQKIFARCFADCKYIFLTCDWKLYRYNYSGKGVGAVYPEIIIQEAIIDNLMLFFPENYSKLSTELLISVYRSSNYLNVQDLAELNSNIQTIIKEDSTLSSYVIKATKNIENYAQITQIYDDGTDPIPALKRVVETQKEKDLTTEKEKRIEQNAELEKKFQEGIECGKSQEREEFIKRKAHHIYNFIKAIKVFLMIFFICAPLVIIILLATQILQIDESDLNGTAQWAITGLMSILGGAISFVLCKFWKVDKNYIIEKLKNKKLK